MKTQFVFILPVVCYFMLILCPVYGQSAKKAPVKPLLKAMPPTWEVYHGGPNGRIPVSGEVRVGIMASESNNKVSPRSFFVKIPGQEAKSSILCVEISSRDGVYEARLPYDITKFEAGVYEFELPTRYYSELRNYSAREITILARVGRGCESNPEYYVPSDWQSPAFGSENLYIYLNSDVSTEVNFLNPDTKSKEVVKCTRINESATAAYNCRCVVPKSKLGSKAPATRVIRRIKSLSSSQSLVYELPIHL